MTTVIRMIIRTNTVIRTSILMSIVTAAAMAMGTVETLRRSQK